MVAPTIATACRFRIGSGFGPGEFAIATAFRSRSWSVAESGERGAKDIRSGKAVIVSAIGSASAAGAAVRADAHSSMAAASKGGGETGTSSVGALVLARGAGNGRTGNRPFTF